MSPVAWTVPRDAEGWPGCNSRYSSLSRGWPHPSSPIKSIFVSDETTCWFLLVWRPKEEPRMFAAVASQVAIRRSREANLAWPTGRSSLEWSWFWVWASDDDIDELSAVSSQEPIVTTPPPTSQRYSRRGEWCNKVNYEHSRDWTNYNIIAYAYCDVILLCNDHVNNNF